MKLLEKVESELEGEVEEQELVWVVQAKLLTTNQKSANKFAKGLEELGFDVKTDLILRELPKD